ncbi:MAG TPA: histone deacetylase family protein [Patescibacteria group bacterium]
MTILYTPNHHLHHPQHEIFNGEVLAHAEVPDRVDNMVAALQAAEYDLEAVNEATYEGQLQAVIEQIHDPRYVHWLQQTSVTEPLYPSVFNHGETALVHGHPSIQWGNFCTDLFTPIMPQTWSAAVTMAEASLQAAELLASHQQRLVTVVGRPPGHHAGKSRVGGYCYLNNAAVAAHHLSAHGRVAVLDVDYHHGNGTQDIFYERADVITCSIHAHPDRKFPYFAGLDTEIGTGPGLNCNRNFPLPAGITDQEYQPILESALAWLAQPQHQPEYLIISLGLDTHESDPIADFQLTTAYYRQMATTLSDLHLPTVVVLEGGYNTKVIGENLVNFVQGLAN